MNIAHQQRRASIFGCKQVIHAFIVHLQVAAVKHSFGFRRAARAAHVRSGNVVHAVRITARSVRFRSLTQQNANSSW